MTQNFYSVPFPNITICISCTHEIKTSGYSKISKTNYKGYSGTLLFQTSEMQTPHFNGRFAQVQIAFPLIAILWAIPFNKGTLHGLQSYWPIVGQKFWLDTPKTNSSLQRITENLYWNSQDSMEISQCVNTPRGRHRKIIHRGVPLLNEIAHWNLDTPLFCETDRFRSL